jgi:hypothetical protein
MFLYLIKIIIDDTKFQLPPKADVVRVQIENGR